MRGLPYIIILGVLSLLTFLPIQKSWADDGKFVVVIDAGHGGEDAGAIGAFSKEKNINLGIALKVGNYLKMHCPDVRVVYTRDADFFVTLKGRANIANKEKADLFVSIHTNSVAKESQYTHPVGVQSYTLTLRTAAENLDVEKRENSVLQYESDGQGKYTLSNDDSSESNIMYELMQDRDMQESIDFATTVQNEMVRAGGRKDKGVLQANLAVLRWTYMPSVLIEVGFICTPEEERFLNSEDGNTIMAKCIFNAIAKYKLNHTGRMSNIEKISDEEMKKAQMASETSAEKLADASSDAASQTNVDVAANGQNQQNVVKPETVQKTEKIEFKIQLFTASAPATKDQLKGIKAQYYQEAGVYKYTYGCTSDYDEIVKLRKDVVEQFPNCFIVAFCDGVRINTNDAKQRLKNKK